MQAKSKKKIHLPAKVNYIEIFKGLKGIRSGSKIPYNKEFGMSVETPAFGLIRLLLKKEGELVLPSIPDTKVKDIWDIIKTN